MGDHRANIKITFDFHGKKYEMDAWINYTPDYNGLDRRVVEFFEQAYEDGMSRYDERMRKLHEQENQAATERAEREELARLKAKYE